MTDVSAATSEDALRVELRPIDSPAQGPEEQPKVSLPPEQRVGFAIQGLGKLALDEVLPAFGRCRYARAVALISGSPDKAARVARQYGIEPTSIYGYDEYERLARNAAVQVVYNILPNSLHAEHSIRAAQAGKHVLCEKPMANSVRDCERMIEAFQRHRLQLMIAYRSQLEPLNRKLVTMVAERKLGSLREIISSNSQNQGRPDQWRHKRALAGGGAMPDIGIYCLNAARFISGEEPIEVLAQSYSTPGDPRFAEVEESMRFILRFPSGLGATCTTSYSSYVSKFLRLQGSEGWAELDPAYTYRGQRLRTAQLVDGKPVMIEAAPEPVDQFALEIDHFADCILHDRAVHTPGEEGLQDQHVIEALYRSAQTGRAVRLDLPQRPTRGPAPREL